MRETYCSVTQIVEAMDVIVHNTMKTFKSDFFKHDISKLYKLEEYETTRNNADKSHRFIWAVRENGTNLFEVPQGKKLKDCDYYNILNDAFSDDINYYGLLVSPWPYIFTFTDELKDW